MQAIIARNATNGSLRYAGSLLAQQQEDEEELLIFQVSEIDLLIIKRLPTAITIEERLEEVGSGLYRKREWLRVIDTPETEQVRQELKNSMSAEEYERRMG